MTTTNTECEVTAKDAYEMGREVTRIIIREYRDVATQENRREGFFDATPCESVAARFGRLESYWLGRGRYARTGEF